MPFRNRSEAGRSLAVALARYKEDEPAILALPSSGLGYNKAAAAVRDRLINTGDRSCRHRPGGFYSSSIRP
jgi:predicted phosphoribosyltransferase